MPTLIFLKKNIFWSFFYLKPSIFFFNFIIVHCVDWLFRLIICFIFLFVGLLQYKKKYHDIGFVCCLWEIKECGEIIVDCVLNKYGLQQQSSFFLSFNFFYMVINYFFNFILTHCID